MGCATSQDEKRQKEVCLVSLLIVIYMYIYFIFMFFIILTEVN